MNRKELFRLLDTASAALALEGEDIPLIFQQFCFTKKSILAYNDVIGIRLLNPGVAFEGTAPGHLLLRFLKSCTGAEIDFVQKNGKWRLESGSTKLDFAHGSVEDFPYKFPASDHTITMGAEDEFFRLLGLCSSIVGDRGGASSWTSGVMCRFAEELTLASVSPAREMVHICKLELRSDMIENIEQVFILPLSFCRTMLAMRKVFHEDEAVVKFGDRYVIAQFGEWNSVFGKVILTDEPVDIIGKSADMISTAGEFVSITSKFREIIERAADISPKDSISVLTIKDGEKLLLRTKVPGGVIRDSISLKEEYPDIQVSLDPKRILLKMDSCEEFAVNERLIALRSEDSVFTRLVANKS